MIVQSFSSSIQPFCSLPRQAFLKSYDFLQQTFGLIAQIFKLAFKMIVTCKGSCFKTQIKAKTECPQEDPSRQEQIPSKLRIRIPELKPSDLDSD